MDSLWRFGFLSAATLSLLVGCGQSSPSTGTAGAGGVVANGVGSGGVVGRGGSSSVGGAVGRGGTSSAGGSPVAGVHYVTGDACKITTDTQWEAGVHVVTCNIDVSGSLTIEPGAIVKFGPGNHLNVRSAGVLSAIGTEALPIVFTSIKDDEHGGDSGADGATVGASNDWGCQGECGGLNLEGKGSVLEFVQDLYSSSGVYVRAESVQIKDSVFAHHANYGLVLDERSGVETTQLTRNAFFENDGYPLYMGAAIFLDSSNIFHDPSNPDRKNTKQCIEIGIDIDRLAVIGVTELGLLFSGHKVSSVLLLPPGVIFKAKDDSITLESSGSFANGPNMIFTSYKDDSLGGDCTGDGDTAPAVGDWLGVWIDDGTNSGYAEQSDDIRYAANHGTVPLH